MKKQLKNSNEERKDMASRIEHYEKEKLLADKVTNELLQRIQIYENEIQELKRVNEELSIITQQA